MTSQRATTLPVSRAARPGPSAFPWPAARALRLVQPAPRRAGRLPETFPAARPVAPPLVRRLAGGGAPLTQPPAPGAGAGVGAAAPPAPPRPLGGQRGPQFAGGGPAPPAAGGAPPRPG